MDVFFVVKTPARSRYPQKRSIVLFHYEQTLKFYIHIEQKRSIEFNCTPNGYGRVNAIDPEDQTYDNKYVNVQTIRA